MDRFERLNLKLRENYRRRALPAFLAKITQNTDLSKDDLPFCDLRQSDEWRKRFWDKYRTQREQGTLAVIRSTQNPDEAHEAAMALLLHARSSKLVVLFHEDSFGAARVDKNLFFQDAIKLLRIDSNQVCVAEDDFSGGALFDADRVWSASRASKVSPSIITYTIESWGTWAMRQRTA